ncbi:PAC2 family protein [Halorussus caseinilyticus]|uniref:PAC2 family protein n=1 Tax=Halorussus caseinilyticus TaxID=3034025 RepID=A0ABD5WVR5_9EURY
MRDAVGGRRGRDGDVRQRSPAEVEPDGERSLRGVATGDGERLLADHDIDPPATDGVWSGPTGALLARASEVELDAVGLVVETDPEFPDPEAACAYINRAVNPIAGLSVDDADLRAHVEEIRAEKEQLAHQMNESGDDSSRAEPVGMYQ